MKKMVEEVTVEAVTKQDLAEKIRLLIEGKSKPEEQMDNPPPDNPPEEQMDNPPPDEQGMEGGDPNAGMPPEQGMEGGDPNAGMPPEEGMEGETDITDVGKMYELKQIHYRLLAVRNHLEIFVEEEFDEVKNSLTKAIELFEVVIDNYTKYRDRIDEIIIMYYQFIKNVYELTKKKYRKYTNKKKKKNVGF